MKKSLEAYLSAQDRSAEIADDLKMLNKMQQTLPQVIDLLDTEAEFGNGRFPAAERLARELEDFLLHVVPQIILDDMQEDDNIHAYMANYTEDELYQLEMEAV